MTIRAGLWMSAAMLAIAVSACGGGGGGGGGSGAVCAAGSQIVTPPPQASNAMSTVVNSGPYGNLVNQPLATVKICAPGTTICQSVTGILVDTGSYGLRLFANSLSSSLRSALTPEMTTSGNPVGECVPFASFVIWGPIVKASVTLGGETTTMAIPTQVVGDSSFNRIPSSCSGLAPTVLKTSCSAGVRGVLGIGFFPNDRGGGIYYSCSSSGCRPFTVGAEPPNLDVVNPVVQLPVDNNGLIVELPNVASRGAPSIAGQVLFGIGTQSNNGLGSATAYTVDSFTGTFTTSFQGSSLTSSFIDTGSNAFFFASSPPLPSCSGFYCPSTTQNLSARITGKNGASTTVDFSVASARTLFATGDTVFNNLAGPVPFSNSFDWGLPFFLGRQVFIGIQGQPQPLGAPPAPYFAF